jgi:DNA adenine methylase
MRYQGGKSRLSKYIAPIINAEIEKYGITDYYEPFVGSGAVVEKIICKNRYASDINSDMIAMFQALRNGWVPPESVSEDEYKQYKANKEALDPALRAFVSIGCSFGGKLWGGLARGRGTEVGEAFRSVKRTCTKTHDVLFSCVEYAHINPKSSILYCDPPYANTLAYGSIDFDSVTFWDKVREWSKTNIVFVSEYSAPSDIPLHTEFNHVKTINNINGGKQTSSKEKLYRVSYAAQKQ